MFVKLRPWNTQDQDTIAEVPRNAALHYGTQVSLAAPKDRDYNEELKISTTFAHIEGIRDEATGQERTEGEDGVGEAEDYWIYRYVWYWDDDRGLILFVTSGDIYILADSGKTIDKVR